MIVIPDVDIYIKTQNHRKELPKTQKKNNLLKSKKIVQTKI